MTKHDSKVLQNAGDSEPIFVLRAQDETAVRAIRYWYGINAPFISAEKRGEVLAIINAMEQWPNRKMPD